MNGIGEIVELNNRAAAAAGYSKWPEPELCSPDEEAKSRLDISYKESEES